MAKKEAQTILFYNCPYVHIPSLIELLKAEKEDWKDETAGMYIDRLIKSLTEKVEEAKNA